MRLLTLPQDILVALEQGRISEGHTRPLLMLANRPEEQLTLFKEMLIRKMTVREAEGIARRIAFDKVRKKDRFFDPDIADMEGRLAESLGTRVHIEKKEVGGKILIDFFSYEELQNILTMLEREQFAKSKVLKDIQESPIKKYEAIPASIIPTSIVAETMIDTRVSNSVDEGTVNIVQDDRISTPATYTHSGDVGIVSENMINTIPQTKSDMLPNTFEPNMPTAFESTQVAAHEPNLLAVFTEELPEVHVAELPNTYSAQLPSTDMLELDVAVDTVAPEEKPAYILDDRTKQETRAAEDDDDIYNIKNFSL
jgi:hypothetical protein